MTGNAGVVPLRGRTVLFLFASLELGGSERQAFQLAVHLREKHGALPRVLAISPGAGRFAALCEAHGIPRDVHPTAWPPGRRARLSSLLSFARRLRLERPDVLMPYNLLPNLLCGLTWRLTGARTSVWNLRNDGTGLDGSRLHRLAVRLTPRFLANSRHGRDFLVARYGVPGSRIRVVPNGVALPPPIEGRAAWRERLGIAGSAFVGCMVANIHPAKDHATLLGAWRRVADGASAAGVERPVLLLAGREDDAAPLKALAFELGLGGLVRFLGPVDDVAGLYDAVDLFILSSRGEGCPNALLEAMAAGLPYVASDIPGVREAVGPGGFRFLAAPGDPEALAGRILEALADPGPRAAAARAMAGDVRKRFDPEAAYEAAARAIGDALGGGAGA